MNNHTQYGYQPVAQPQHYYPVTQPDPNDFRGKKQLGLAYVLLLTGGIVGFHHFYLGNPLKGIVYMCTLGGLFLGLLIDLLTLPSQVRRINTLRRLGLR